MIPTRILNYLQSTPVFLLGAPAGQFVGGDQEQLRGGVGHQARLPRCGLQPPVTVARAEPGGEEDPRHQVQEAAAPPSPGPQPRVRAVFLRVRDHAAAAAGVGRGVQLRDPHPAPRRRDGGEAQTGSCLSVFAVLNGFEVLVRILCEKLVTILPFFVCRKL